MVLLSCAGCGSFVPARVSACPECGAAAPDPGLLEPGRRVLRGALAIAGGSLFAVTLAACYGAAYRLPDDDAGARRDASGECDDLASDEDADGFCGDADCDESDPNRNAGAMDVPGDGVDSDCDGAD